jgi:hypothetical protein
MKLLTPILAFICTVGVAEKPDAAQAYAEWQKAKTVETLYKAIPTNPRDFKTVCQPGPDSCHSLFEAVMVAYKDDKNREALAGALVRLASQVPYSADAGFDLKRSLDNLCKEYPEAFAHVTQSLATKAQDKVFEYMSSSLKGTKADHSIAHCSVNLTKFAFNALAQRALKYAPAKND